MTMRKALVVYCPNCREELCRCLTDGTAAFEVHRHHQETGHEPGILAGHFDVEGVDDD
jgi:hypothetical protein